MAHGPPGAGARAWAGMGATLAAPPPATPLRAPAAWEPLLAGCTLGGRDPQLSDSPGKAQAVGGLLPSPQLFPSPRRRLVDPPPPGKDPT